MDRAFLNRRSATVVAIVSLLFAGFIVAGCGGQAEVETEEQVPAEQTPVQTIPETVVPEQSEAVMK